MNPFHSFSPVVGKARIEIHKPINQVFAFVGEAFFDNYPKWAVEVSDFKPLDGTKACVGAKAKQIREEQGQQVESIFEISEFDPPKKMALIGIDAHFRNSYNFFANGSNDSTELEFCFELLELELFMRPFQKLIRMAIEEGAENTVENIKNLLSQQMAC